MPARILGSSEFCSILNGQDEDPTFILKTMKRFLRTVQSQQQQSSASRTSKEEEDSKEDDPDADSDDAIQPKRKKLKTESWKEDTAAYNVPFVGTAVTAVLDPVDPNVWPTGLLKAYLEKSPIAIELHNRFLPTQIYYERQQQKNVADEIASCTWQILTVLLMHSKTNTRLLQHVHSTTLPITLECLKHSKHQETIVRFLTALAAGSPPAARTMARHLSGDMGIIRSLVSQSMEAFLQLIMTLRHDGILGMAFPLAIRHRDEETLAPLVSYVEHHMNRSWYFITKDVLRTLRRKPGCENLLKALALNFAQSPLYARNSNEPLLLQLLAQVLLKDTRTIRTVLQYRPSLLDSLYQELPPLPDPSANPIGYIAVVRTLTMLAREFSSDAFDLPKQFRRPQIAKAIHSPHPVVSYQTWVYLVAVLDHVRIHGASEASQWSQALPDANVVLNCVSKFRGFGKHQEVLRAFAALMLSKRLEVFPSNESFDLTKLLPTSSSFGQLPTCLQDLLLTSVRRSLDHSKPDPTLLIKLFKHLMTIALHVRHVGIFKTVRDLSIHVFRKTQDAEDSCSHHNNSTEADFEAALWVDGMSSEWIDIFNGLMQKAARLPNPRFISIARAWKNAGFDWPVAPHSISNVLLTVVQNIPTLPEAFTLFAVQVILRILLYSECPLVLASLVLDLVPIGTECHPSVKCLVDYCSSLVKFDAANGIERKRCLMAVLDFLPKQFLLNQAFKFVNEGTNKTKWLDIEMNHEEALYALLHCSLVMDESTKEFCCEAIYQILPLCAASNKQLPWKRIQDALVSDTGRQKSMHLLRLLSSQHEPVPSQKIDCEELFLYLQADYLPTVTLMEVSIAFLKSIVADKQIAGMKTMDCLLQINHSRVLCNRELKDIEEPLINEFLMHSMSAWLELGSEDSSNSNQDLVRAIESAMVHMLRSSDYGLEPILSFDAEQIVTNCLSNYESNSYREHCLLSTLIRWDPVLYKKKFLAANERLAKTEPYRTNCIKGQLDGVFVAVAEMVQEGDVSQTNLFIQLIDWRGSYLASCDRHSLQGHGNHFVAVLFSLKDSFIEHPLHVFEGVLEYLLMIIHSTSANEDGHNMVLEVAAILCSKNDPSCIEKLLKLKQNLQIGLLKSLCPQLRASLRSLKKDKLGKNSPGYEKCCLVIRLLRRTIENVNDHEEKQDVAYLAEATKACIRFAINSDPDGLIDMRSDVLSLLHCLLVVFRSGLKIGKLDLDSASRMIFELSTTHSQFTSVCTNHESPGCLRLQAKMFQMLGLCLEVNKAISFERSTWRSFATAYSGSPSPKDSLVYHVLELYAKRAKEYPRVSLFLMREFRAPSGNHDDSSWDWFLEFITRPRIEKTLANFPSQIVQDVGLEFVEVECTDERYNPEFVVRLALAAMLQLDSSGSEETASRFAKALCDKGVVGLALATLCSQLSQTRKEALGLLGLFESITTSESARRLQSWKDRPQQLMLVRSVRYCCCVEFASTKSSSEMLFATSIPTFTAIYLARSSLILSQPSHPLYGSMNKSLLSSEVDAGAFQDFARVPGFLALFCSTNIDLEQLRYERGFALRLLRDGYISPGCFPAISKCRAPEMLMAAVFTDPPYPSFHERMNERLLILAIFEKIILFSNDEAKFSDFIGRVGFISWLRSLLMSRDQHSHQFYVGMLRLLSLTLSKNIQLRSLSINLSLIGGLATAVVEKTVSFLSTTESKNSAIAIIEACCTALVSIAETISKANELFPNLGIEVGLAEDFVDLLIGFNKKGEVVYPSLCRLLVQNESNNVEKQASARIERLCTKLMKNTFSNLSLQSAAEYRAVLGCIEVLLNKVECSEEETRKELLRCRRKCSQDEVARNHWLDCYSNYRKGVRS